MDRLLTVEQAAERLGTSPRFVRRLVFERRIAYVKLGRHVRNGKTSYRARYRDPAGREHAKVFARKADAQRFLTEMENSKLKGAWTNPASGRGAVPRVVRGVAADHG